MNCPLCNHALLAGDHPDARVGDSRELWGSAHLWCPQCRLPFARDRVRKLAAGDRPFAGGDRVLVAGPPGEVVGVVLHAATPYEMPHLGPGSASHETHQLMHEWGVDFLVLIQHHHDDQKLCFFALRHPGGWRDLRGQDLTLTKVGGGE